METHTVRKSLINGADSRIRTADLLITKTVTADTVSHGNVKGKDSPERCGFGEFPELGPRFLADFQDAFATSIKSVATE